MVRLRQRVQGDSAIVAAWLAGSFGRNTQDPYSDIDIALIFNSPAEREMAWQRRVNFCTDILTYVPAKSIDSNWESHIVLFSNGTLVDFRFNDRESLQPNWRDGEIKILKDTADRYAEQHQALSLRSGKQVRAVSSAELQQLDDHFWVLFWDTYRRVRRGSAENGIGDYVKLISHVLPTLLDALPADSPARNNLISLSFSRDATATLAHMRQLVTTYRAARSEIVALNRIAFNIDNAFEREIDRAMKK